MMMYVKFLIQQSQFLIQQSRRELTYPYYPPAVRQYLQELQQRNREQAPLLCLGWGQGYLGTTVMGLVLDEQQGEYERAIRKMLPILPRRGQGIVPSRFPKTRRAVRGVRNDAVYPLGWVQLSVQKSERV